MLSLLTGALALNREEHVRRQRHQGIQLGGRWWLGLRQKRPSDLLRFRLQVASDLNVPGSASCVPSICFKCSDSAASAF